MVDNVSIFLIKLGLKSVSILLALYFFGGISYSQNDKLQVNSYVNTYQANTSRIHPLGVFMSGINSNFKFKPETQYSLTAHISSANVWLPYVKSYLPINESDRAVIQNILWHEREGSLDINNTPVEIRELHADGVIRSFQLGLTTPIKDRFELTASARMFSLDRGTLPFSLITTDGFVEWYHKHVLGEEDLYARNYYGLDQAQISYVDGKGKSFNIDAGDFFFSGIDLSIVFFPEIKRLLKKKVYTNFAVQMGINTTKINPSIDLGCSSTIMKNFDLTSSSSINLGIEARILRLDLLEFGDPIQLTTNHFLMNTALFSEYVKRTKNGFVSLAVTYYLQSSYYKRKEFDYAVLSGNRVFRQWHLTMSHLYEWTSYHGIVFTYGKKKFTYWVYYRNDVMVNNAPDIQVGLGVKMQITDSSKE